MPVAEFSEIVRHFTALAKAPSDEVASPAKTEWIIDGLQASIALATVKGVSTEPDVIEKAVSAYAAAGRALEGTEPIPYSPKITCDASGIAAVLHDKVASIRFEADLGDVTIISPSAQGTSPRPRYALGGVGGVVEPVTSPWRLRFTLYHALFDRAVTCHLGEGQEDIMRQPWGKRVVVSARVG